MQWQRHIGRPAKAIYIYHFNIMAEQRSEEAKLANFLASYGWIQQSIEHADPGLSMSSSRRGREEMPQNLIYNPQLSIRQAPKIFRLPVDGSRLSCALCTALTGEYTRVVASATAVTAGAIRVPLMCSMIT